MESLFEVETVYTKDVLRNVFKQHYKHIQSMVRNIYLIFGCVFMLNALLRIISINIEGIAVLIIFSLLSIFFFLMYYIGHLFTFKASYKNTMVFNPTGETTIYFYDDRLISNTPLSSLTVFYTQITKAVETNDLYILAFESIQILFAEKAKFVKGNPEELGKVLRNTVRDYKYEVK